jgi:hypothetical protein
MIWTHFYDLIIKLFLLFVSILIVINIPFIDQQPILILFFILFISISSYILYLRTFSSFLYCRFTLKMNISMEEARKLNPALSPAPFSIGGLKWLPLKEVKTLPTDKKYEAALSLLENWLKNKDVQKKVLQVETSTTIKILEYSVLVVFLYLLLASHFDLPPSHYFIMLYCKIFNTNEYSPMLITMLLTLVYCMPVLFIKKKILKNKKKE